MKNERQKKIISILEVNEYCSISELAKTLNISEMTIRRDINELEKEKLLFKEQGGARRRNRVLSTDEKINKHIEEKEYIGTVMNSIIHDNDVIFIGAGTTVYHAIKSIDKLYKSIITNSLFTFNWLVQNKFDNIFLTGGELYQRTSEFVGLHAESFFDNLNIDIAFLSTNGIYNENVTTSNPSLGRLQVKVMNASKKNILIADSSKFDYSDMYTFTTLDKIDSVITDNKISDEKFEYYSKYTKMINRRIDS
ncbi:hypothetical protein BKP56_01200 [Marinilactibacillus sp. 15R]|uniref:Lactose phosphotransferase system repressor n=1 Tax=Marinilactibacillus piezotolerans TaxID=258723 RepID=A0A1I3ZQB5_9LACT|nr:MULTISPECIES: DeoR/GlpR family DNA-binding transcription regulator [Marinilactibacillus]API88032.1 hypothetical protein BKP56_01200 [Marinilactibacillus sp. 15R]SFK46354.1 transcriptional regulator, DeoR family [Marinilactibacillus piezotolerans]